MHVFMAMMTNKKKRFERYLNLQIATNVIPYLENNNIEIGSRITCGNVGI